MLYYLSVILLTLCGSNSSHKIGRTERSRPVTVTWNTQSEFASKLLVCNSDEVITHVNVSISYNKTVTRGNEVTYPQQGDNATEICQTDIADRVEKINQNVTMHCLSWQTCEVLLKKDNIDYFCKGYKQRCSIPESSNEHCLTTEARVYYGCGDNPKKRGGRRILPPVGGVLVVVGAIIAVFVVYRIFKKQRRNDNTKDNANDEHTASSPVTVKEKKEELDKDKSICKSENVYQDIWDEESSETALIENSFYEAGTPNQGESPISERLEMSKGEDIPANNAMDPMVEIKVTEVTAKDRHSEQMDDLDSLVPLDETSNPKAKASPNIHPSDYVYAYGHFKEEGRERCPSKSASDKVNESDIME